ncbi:hypothetical protein GCM10009099_27830 [Caenispirillum bisanense]
MGDGAAEGGQAKAQEGAEHLAGMAAASGCRGGFGSAGGGDVGRSGIAGRHGEAPAGDSGGQYRRRSPSPDLPEGGVFLLLTRISWKRNTSFRHPDPLSGLAPGEHGGNRRK